MSKKNIFKSATAGLIEEAVALICGFILPRMILVYFGSTYNGIIAAVTQFIGCIALLKSGIGMATKAALYKPLYENDQEKINGIMSATMSFLRKVASIFVAGIIIFACVYPFVIEEEFSWLFVFSLVLIVSLGTFFQYYFGLGNQLLLEADQKNYIISIIAAVNTFFNMLISVICMKAGLGIHGVKLFSSLVYCTTPVLLYVYVNRTYHLNRKAVPDTDSISKRWDALGMQIANFINSNTSIILASIFLSLKEVSVYTVYYLAINGIKKIVVRITSGVESAIGKMVVQGDQKRLNANFALFEFVLNFVCIVLFSCLMTIIIPFVNIYTAGITDVNYTRYVFGFVACAAELFYCLRLSYTYLVQAKGAFSETKKYYYVESVMHIFVSIALVKCLGLVGIVIGTLTAMVYRTITFAYYSSKYILARNLLFFTLRILVTVCNIFVNCITCIPLINNIPHGNYIQLLLASVPVGIVILCITSLMHYLLYREDFKRMTRLMLGRIMRQMAKQK